MKRGKLIVIEGCDGSGKETQTKLLVNNLVGAGHWVSSLAFPRYDTAVGGRILKYILKSPSAKYFDFSNLPPEVASLFYTADRVESKPELEKMLSENDYVILDRYFTSNLLHQGAKFEKVDDRNKYIQDFSKIELDILSIPRPDLVIYLQLPYEVSLKRINNRSEVGGQSTDSVERDLEYIKRSNEKGVSIAEHCGWKVVSCVEGEVELDRETIARKIKEIVTSFEKMTYI